MKIQCKHETIENEIIVSCLEFKVMGCLYGEKTSWESEGLG